MKRFILLLAALFCLMPGVAGAEIHKVDTRVVLHKDGSATVSQIWKATVSSGTEWYIPIENIGEMTISDLHVYENGCEFLNDGEWNSSRSRDEKAGRCGIIHKRNGVELCWGQGEYGTHTWSCEYTVEGMVMSYEEADALFFQFVNDELGDIDSVSLHIFPDEMVEGWNGESVKVWAFGYDGEIYFTDGVVEATAYTYGNRSRLIALVRFEKGIFTPSVTGDGSFESLLDKALEGSDYSRSNDKGERSFAEKIGHFFAWFIAFGWIVLLIVVGIFYGIYAWISSKLGYKYKTAVFGKNKIDEWYRDVPVGGDLTVAYHILKNGGRFGSLAKEGNLIGAFFLRWILEDVVRVSPGAKRNQVDIAFTGKEIQFSSTAEKQMYYMVLQAAGENEILEKNEFERWAEKNYSKMSDWPKTVAANAEKKLKEAGWSHGGTHFTPEGQQEACNLIGFQKYLNDFTLSAERNASEVALWNDYLVFAQLFGIADKVAAEFKKLYPDDFAKYAERLGMNPALLMHTINHNNYVSRQAFSSARAAKASYEASRGSGGGGHSSFGGGMGHFGGGHGGGSR